MFILNVHQRKSLSDSNFSPAEIQHFKTNLIFISPSPRGRGLGGGNIISVGYGTNGVPNPLM